MVKTQEMIAENLTRGTGGELLLAGVSVSEMAKKYGTPLYLYDEDRVRECCRKYKNAMADGFGEGGLVLYASKAASFKRIYEIMKDEGMGIDVVSMGEIYTAKVAGFPLANAFFHSNNKTDEDIEYAIKNGVGYFVVDNGEELHSIDRIAGECGVRQRILLRLTPGIDPHTFSAVSTGKVDSKFGSAIETGQAEEITRLALSLGNIELAGFHCHVGSMVFDSTVFLDAARVMLSFAADMRDRYGYVTKILDIGGGFGVRYIEEQPVLDIRKCIGEIAKVIHGVCRELDFPCPTVAIEPGRSIVADAALTVYTVGTVKHIPGYKSYVSVDGGMTDNPRFALYKSPYTVVPVCRDVGDDTFVTSIVGRCCESGDILQENQVMPRDIARGEYIACLITGAYNYSMASNYNRIPRPPVVMLSGGVDSLAVRRETVEDIVGLDI